MSRYAVLLALAASVALPACSTQKQVVQGKEDMLAAAGFTVLPADTPGRQTQLSTLPPNKFVMRPHGDHVVYLYADPLVCGCLYVGSQQAYDQYRQQQLQRRLANEQQMTAQLYQSASWDWAPWGGGFY